MSDTKLILIEARQKISEGWTQRAYARMSNEVDDGGKVSADSRLATCWCVMGALVAVTPDLVRYDQALDTIMGIIGEKHTGDIIDWNDDPARTQEEVLELFDRAIATC